MKFLALVRPNLFNLALKTRKMPAASVFSVQKRFASGRPEKAEFEKRALEVLRGFEKIDAKNVIIA